MYGFLCKRLLVHNVKLVRNPTQNQLGFLPTIIAPPTKSLFLSSSPVKNEQEQSFTVSYLMNSCGLSLENAITASKKVHLKNPHKPDSILKFFENHGFSNAQITKIIRQRPEFLVANPEKSFLPKLEFFKSIGLSASALSKTITLHSTLLALSLDNRIIPSYNYIKSIVTDDDEKIVKALIRFPKIMNADVIKRIASNISVLKDHGVPADYILLLFTRFGSSLAIQCDKFEKCVKEVIEMGSKPSALAFVLAVKVIAEMTESTWNRKEEVYRQWGWSETEFRAAFRTNPILMNLSEKKITSGMEFLVNTMGFEPAALAKNPTVLCYSLEKRVIPRCAVIKLLLLKGLINKYMGLGTFMFPAEKVFLDKFVTKYEKDAPDLLSVYQGKMRSFKECEHPDPLVSA